MSSFEVLYKILELARWAPSGDNTQPWRFELNGTNRIAVHGYDTRSWCVYDIDGRASFMAHGALLETIRIAATEYQLRADWSLRSGSTDTAPIYDIKFEHDPELMPDKLIPYIKTRSVYRRPMQMAPLSDALRKTLQSSLSAGYKLQFFSSMRDRMRVAKLLWKNAYIRLTCKEAYQVHKKIIEWNAAFSRDRIPEKAIGVDFITAKLMRWVMQDWKRLDFFNRYLLGTIVPRIQLDLLPAIGCSAHACIKVEKEPQSLLDFVSAGIVMQRFWLTCTANGLLLQPEMTPVIFHWYADKGFSVSHSDSINSSVKKLSNFFVTLFCSNQEYPIFLCRIGVADQSNSRSIRMDLEDLMWKKS